MRAIEREPMVKPIENVKISKENIISLAMLLLLFLFMYALNFLMPLHRDDYEYALIWGTYENYGMA